MPRPLRAQLDEKVWFVILLALGVWNMGFIAMVVYVIAGPDGASRQPAAPVADGWAAR